MLSLSKSLQGRLASEFRFAATMMAESPDLPTKLFFFSAFYGEVARVLNRSWSADLALVNLVLQVVHQQFSGRVNASGAEAAIRITREFPEALDRIANEFAEVFEAKQIDDARLHQALARAAELGYATIGNGYYLYRKGQIKI